MLKRRNHSMHGLIHKLRDKNNKALAHFALYLERNHINKTNVNLACDARPGHSIYHRHNVHNFKHTKPKKREFRSKKHFSWYRVALIYCYFHSIQSFPPAPRSLSSWERRKKKFSIDKAHFFTLTHILCSPEKKYKALEIPISLGWLTHRTEMKTKKKEKKFVGMWNGFYLHFLVYILSQQPWPSSSSLIHSDS